MKQHLLLKTLFDKVQSQGKKFLSIELFSAYEFDVKQLNRVDPAFCSFTWHDGEITTPYSLPAIALAEKLRKNGTNGMLMHLSGRNLKHADALTILNTAKEIGVRNILTLKGGAKPIEEDDTKCDFPYAIDLVKFVKSNFGDYFNVAVSGYPIGHPDSKDPIKDLPYLKRKVDAGGDIIVCQAVFDAKTFRDFYRRCRDLKIEVPILPGLYIINSYSLLKQLMGFCKVVPEDFLKFITENKDNNEAIRNYGINYAAELVKSLLRDQEISIPGVHIFSFNGFDLVEEVYKKLDFTELNLRKPNELF